MNLYNTQREVIDVPVLIQLRIIGIALVLSIILLIVLSRCFLAGVVDAVLGWKVNLACYDTTAILQQNSRDSVPLDGQNVYSCPVIINGKEVIDCEGTITSEALDISRILQVDTIGDQGKQFLMIDKNGIITAETVDMDMASSDPDALESEPEEPEYVISDFVYYDGGQMLSTTGSTLSLSQGNNVLLSGSYDEDGNVSLGYLGGTTKINGDEIIFNDDIFKDQGNKMLVLDDDGVVQLYDLPGSDNWGSQGIVHVQDSLLTGRGTSKDPLSLRAADIFSLFRVDGPLVYDGAGTISCPGCLTSQGHTGPDTGLGLDTQPFIRIESLEKKQEEMKAQYEQVSIIGPLVDEIDTDVQIVREDVSNLVVTVDQQGNIIDEQTEKIETASTTLNRYGDLITDVEGDVAGIRDHVGSVEQVLAETSVNVERMEQRLHQAKNLEDTYQQLSSSVSASLTSVRTQVTDVYRSIDQFEIRIAELESQVLAASGSATIDISPREVSPISLEQNAELASLSVTGQTSLFDLGVAGTFTAGLIGIDGIEGTINTLSEEPLRLQTLGVSGIEMVQGKVRIDPSGNISLHEGVLKLNSQMYGVETIEPDQDTVEVVRQWKKSPVVVNAIPEYDTYVWIENISETGFVIRVKNPPSDTRHIHWQAAFGLE